jgi:hypothetical protein
LLLIVAIKWPRAGGQWPHVGQACLFYISDATRQYLPTVRCDYVQRNEGIGFHMSTPVREYLDGPMAYAPPVHRQAAVARLSSPCFVLIDGERCGPMSSNSVVTMAKTGTITADMLVWREGWEDWRPARSIDWLEKLFVE